MTRRDGESDNAAVCKTVTPGSTPGRASNSSQVIVRDNHLGERLREMAKLVNAHPEWTGFGLITHRDVAIFVRLDER